MSECIPSIKASPILVFMQVMLFEILTYKQRKQLCCYLQYYKTFGGLVTKN